MGINNPVLGHQHENLELLSALTELEGKLAYKGIILCSASIPTPTPTLWTPANIALSIWLDASDESTVMIGNQISQINDKSGNSRNYIQATGASQPAYMLAALNNKNVVSFDGVNDYLQVSLTNFGNIITMFFVAKYNDSNRRGLYDTGPLAEHTARNFSSNSIEWWPDSPALALDAPINDWALISVTYSLSDNGRKIEKWINDTNYASATNPSGYGIAWNNPLLGIINFSANPFNGSIAEFVMINSALTVDIRQKLFGYAAHKWGLQSKLEATHPYKNLAPTV